MRQRTGLFKIYFLIFLLLFWLFPITSNAFYGFTNEPGSHIDLTQTTFTTVYGSPSGKVFPAETIPIYSIHYYRWKPNRTVDFLSDASRMTDIYFFGPAYPHAQTRSYPVRRTYSNKEIEDIEVQALSEFFIFMADTLKKVRNFYEKGDTRSALFWLGIFLHGYEDLFAHQGITNEQHLWLQKKGQNPDTSPKSIQQCRESLIPLVNNIPALLGPIAGPKFQRQLASTAQIQPTTAKERRRILGRSPDIYWEGIKYELISAPPICARYLDRIRWDYPTLARLFNSRESLEAAQIKDLKALKVFLKGYGYKF